MRVGIIADDLTGANGTGVKLVEQGFITNTNFIHSKITNKSNEAVVCMDIDSRYTSPVEAKNRVHVAIQKFKEWEADIICKRIDSTFRGNIGVEIDAMLAALGPDKIGIVVPSYPAYGRVVVGGYLLVNGVPLNETDVANDPVHPIKKSNLPDILKEQTKTKLDFIGLDDINSGSDMIEQQLKQKINAGARIIICDSTKVEHINSIAKAMVNMGKENFIPIDSGPLTSEFIRNVKISEKSSKKIKTLISIGSTTSHTEKQIKFLIDSFKVEPIYVDAEKLIFNEAISKAEIERVVHLGKRMVDESDVILVTTNQPNKAIIDFHRITLTENVTEDVLARRITDGLGEISKQLITYSSGEIKGCLFSGGDVTASFCEIVQASSINLIDEVMPLIAHGKLVGGEFSGLSIITKGGLVGDESAIIKSLTYINQFQNTNSTTVHT